LDGLPLKTNILSIDEMNERRYDIDWLRVLVMLAVFFFHCARFFGGPTWHLNNSEESIVPLVFMGWLDMWFMPLFCLLSGVGSWYALRSRNNGFSNNILAYGNEAVLPIYILHQTIILCVGWFVIRWNIGILPKYMIIVVASFALIMAVYEGVVRRSNPIRFLFGMRPKKEP
jgi:peptidoglycan/LPS O-acetylase OafA/YrhL